MLPPTPHQVGLFVGFERFEMRFTSPARQPAKHERVADHRDRRKDEPLHGVAQMRARIEARQGNRRGLHVDPDAVGVELQDDRGQRVVDLRGQPSDVGSPERGESPLGREDSAGI